MILETYDERGELSEISYDFEVSGCTYDEIVRVANRQAKQFYGESDFVIHSVDVRPGIEQIGTGVTVYFASVQTKATAA